MSNNFVFSLTVQIQYIPTCITDILTYAPACGAAKIRNQKSYQRYFSAEKTFNCSQIFGHSSRHTHTRGIPSYLALLISSQPAARRLCAHAHAGENNAQSKRGNQYDLLHRNKVIMKVAGQLSQSQSQCHYDKLTKCFRALIYRSTIMYNLKGDGLVGPSLWPARQLASIQSEK